MGKNNKQAEHYMPPKDRKQSIAKSFRFAFEGVWTGFRKERNMKIHASAIVLVTAAGLFFHISAVEWCIVCALFGMVVGFELVNTAVEAIVDLVSPEYHPLAKIAKDTAAGATLAAAIGAAAAGLIIFLPKLAAFFGGAL